LTKTGETEDAHGENGRLLEVDNLSIHYFTDDGVVRAVNGLNLSLGKGETLGLVGETGAGKTTSALGLLRLVPNPPGRIVGGRILLDGIDLARASEREMRSIRGRKVSMIFQDPMTSLNPVMQVRDQIAEVVLLHERLTAKEALAKAEEVLGKVGIGSERAREYPHQFSGGMRQRVVIAMALACNPRLLIADEPTTALDVTVQAQVLRLMENLKTEYGTAMIMITHDLGIVADVCDRVAIMYAGGIVEQADKRELFRNPKHPYTVGLFGSLPDIRKDAESLRPIPGLMPDPRDLPTGCPFHPRCDAARDECRSRIPENVEVGEGHTVKCLLFEKGAR